MSLHLDEVRDLPDPELLAQLEENREELFNLRFQNATGQLENYKRMGIVKKEIARLETVLRERELGIESRPVTSEKTRKRRLSRDEAAKESEEDKGKEKKAEKAEASDDEIEDEEQDE